MNFAQLSQAILILAGTGRVVAVQDEAVIPKAKKHNDKLNAYLIGKARGSGEITCLAGTMTGAARW